VKKSDLRRHYGHGLAYGVVLPRTRSVKGEDVDLHPVAKCPGVGSNS
jgi:hypothetical protein